MPLDARTKRTGLRQKPVRYVDVYVDDFIGLAQGSQRARNQVRDTLLHSIDQVFRPQLHNEEKQRQEPTSVKKLSQGDGHWTTQKTVLGWKLDFLTNTLQLTTRRQDRLTELLDSLPPSKRRISRNKWQKILGELRSMAPALPGSRGLFSPLQEALKGTNTRIKLSTATHDFLQDMRWILNNLTSQVTHMKEVVPARYQQQIRGASDACVAGMGGIFFLNRGTSQTPMLWRTTFPPSI